MIGVNEVMLGVVGVIIVGFGVWYWRIYKGNLRENTRDEIRRTKPVWEETLQQLEVSGGYAVAHDEL